MKRVAITFALLAAAGITASVAASSPAATAPTSAVRFPAGFTTPIWVGNTPVWPTTTTGATTSTSTASSTTSTAPQQSSTSSASTSSSSPATTSSTTSTTTVTSSTSSTSTTVAVSTTTAPSASGCGLSSPAFCDTFDQPANGGTQTGDLDPILWGVSRVGDINLGQNILNGIVAPTDPCGTSTVLPPGDVRICNGQMVEAQNDGHGVVNLDTYPKQPFDFAGRTGTVVFDVSDDSQGTHSAWPEFVITDAPVPGTRGSISLGIPAHAANEIGFALAGCGFGGTSQVGVSAFFSSVNGTYSDTALGTLPFTTTGCMTPGSRTAMNHIEVRVNTTDIEVWGTDAGSTALKQLAVAHNLGLTFTRGLVWMNDVHYNARKSNATETGTEFDHAFAWDNLGFDGPKTYRDLGYDVPLANVKGGNSIGGDPEQNEGYYIGTTGQTFTLPPVTIGTAISAKVVLNAFAYNPSNLSVSINGHTAVTAALPATFSWTSMSIVVPLGDITPGVNTLNITSDEGSTAVANVSLILVAGAAVP